MTYWRDSLLVGVDSIDAEHKELVKAIDELLEACSRGQGRATISKTLAFAVEYAKKHFAHEEKLQEQYAYPAMATHKFLHKQYISNVDQLVRELESEGTSVGLMAKINKTLVDWLIVHISVEDKKVGEHIRKATAQ